jgi:3-dehydroquinate dehydratase
MDKYNPDIKKIATIINKSDDLIDMIKILKKYNDKEDNMIFAPMTDSKIFRLIALKLNSWTNFFCLDDKSKTAKGQISWKEYKKIKNLLF